MPRKDGTGRLGKGKDCNERAKTDRMSGQQNRQQNSGRGDGRGRGRRQNRW